MSLPTYQPLLRPSPQTTQGLGDIAVQPLSTGERAASAGQELGQGLARIGAAVTETALGWDDTPQRRIERAADVSRRQTAFLDEMDAARREAEAADPARASEMFERRAREIEGRARVGLRPEDDASLALWTRQRAITAGTAVRTAALTRQADGYMAGLDRQYQEFVTSYAGAKSPAERQTAQSGLEALLADGVEKGLVTRQRAEGYRQALTATGDHAQALAMIARDPARAAAELARGGFAGVTPAQRVTLAEHAKVAADEARFQRLQRTAAFDPGAAVLASGVIGNPAQIGIVFDRAIMPQESGGNPNAVSVDGAQGVGQIMPGTARQLGAAVGRADLATMPEAELRETLRKDRDLNRRLGIEHLRQGLQATDGSLVAAIAGYHGGNGFAAETHRKAVAAFGPTYTPEQFISLIPADKADGSGKGTASYTRDIYRRLGLPTTEGALTAAGQWRFSQAAGQMAAQEASRQNEALKPLFALERQRADDHLAAIGEGLNVDPARLARTQSVLQAAAMSGDAAAATRLRDLNEAVALAPHIQRAFAEPVEVLDARIAAERQRLAGLGDVPPEQLRALKAMEGVRRTVAAARDNDPIGLSERQGMPVSVVSVPPSFSDPTAMAGFRQSLAQRGVASDHARTRYGGQQQFFRPAEVETVKARWAEMGPGDKVQMLKAIAETASEKAYEAAVRQVAGNDGMAKAAAPFFRSNPELAADIIQGGQIMQMEGVKPAIADIRNAMKDHFGALNFPPAVQQRLVEASVAVYAAGRGRNGALYDSTDRAALEAAATRVTGPVVSINGRKVPVQGGMTPQQLRNGMDNLSGESLAALGGARSGDGTAFDASFLSRHAQLLPLDVTGGRYAVTLPGRDGRPQPVLDSRGAPLVWSLDDFQRVVRPPRSAAARRDRALADSFRQEREALGLVPPASREAGP